MSVERSESEFELIARYFSNVGICPTSVVLGIGDDCALVSVPVGQQLCLSIDTLVEGVHFPKTISAYQLASRALRTALSDLAAMGASPSHFTLALTLPESNSQWLEGFSQGLKFVAEEYGISLIGGDTTAGPLTISIQVHGFVPNAQALTRSGAKAGDRLCVTGYCGDAAAALKLLDKTGASEHEFVLLERYFTPQPRIKQGISLRQYASAAIDISDGLVADAGHIATLSGVRCIIESDRIPMSEALKTKEGEQAINYALSGGDDYELLVTISPDDLRRYQQAELGFDLFDIGHIECGEGVVVVSPQGQSMKLASKGYKHFE